MVAVGVVPLYVVMRIIGRAPRWYGERAEAFNEWLKKHRNLVPLTVVVVAVAILLGFVVTIGSLAVWEGWNEGRLIPLAGVGLGAAALSAVLLALVAVTHQIRDTGPKLKLVSTPRRLHEGPVAPPAFLVFLRNHGEDPALGIRARVMGGTGDRLLVAPDEVAGAAPGSEWRWEGGLLRFVREELAHDERTWIATVAFPAGVHRWEFRVTCANSSQPTFFAVDAPDESEPEEVPVP